MSWGPTRYPFFADEATARAMALQLGAVFPADGSIPTGNGNYALKAPIVEYANDGTLIAGYGAMLRFRLEWAGYAAAMATLQAAGVLQTIAVPRNRFYGD